mgnify:CR=1 FL=1
MTTAKIYYWEFESGEPVKVPKSIVYPDGIQPGNPRGWHCWAFPSNDREFTGWMEQHCPGAEFAWRFNGGNPMYTVRITDAEEATAFQLKWMHHDLES